MSLTAIVLGGNACALGQIRTLHQISIPNYCIVEEGLHSYVTASRCTKGIIVPDPTDKPEIALNAIKKRSHEIKQKTGEKPVLFFAGDPWMQLVGKHEDEIRRICTVPYSPWGILEMLYNKTYLYDLCQHTNTPVPLTIKYRSIEELIVRNEQLPYPCVIKPSLTTDFQKALPKTIAKKTYHRTQVFNNKKDLVEWANSLVSNGVEFPILYQEYIPGGAETLFTLTSYSNKKGELVEGYVGHKLYQFPNKAGRIVSGIIVDNDTVFNQGRRLLESIKYYGLANTEFKWDSRDNTFKLMEVNARLGEWNGSSTLIKLNLIEYAVNDLLEKPSNKKRNKSDRTRGEKLIWCNTILHFITSFILNKKIDPEYRKSLKAFVKDIMNMKMDAVFNWKDPLPWFSYFYKLLRYGVFKR